MNIFSQAGMPGFVTLSGDVFNIIPTLNLLSAIYPITVSLFDGAMTTTSTFNIIVVNLPPTFGTNPLPN